MKSYNSISEKTRHYYLRLSSYILGFLLFYAPFTLFARFIKFITHDHSMSDVHNFCLRLQINWLFDPTKWSNFTAHPVYLGFFLIVASAFLFGPLFCGWLCAAGAVTEYLSKLIPDRLKIDFAAKINPIPIRFGFLIGYIAVPFVTSGSIACAYCNYSVFQKFVNGMTGDWQALTYWGSTMLITTILWVVLFGLFTKGGRGWCNLGCPVGAVQSLFHSIGTKLGFTYKLKYNSSKCSSCGVCVKSCSMRSIRTEDQGVSINHHNCIVCLDCVAVCPSGAITYGKGIIEEQTVVQLDTGTISGK